jgi:hypothetical protein
MDRVEHNETGNTISMVKYRAAPGDAPPQLI